jgi:predicted hydrocarbon binding protein
LGAITLRLFEVFGTGAALILFEMGVRAGENKAERISERYGIGGLKALEVILAERIAKEWGIPKIEVFNEEKLESTITVHELFECLSFRGEGREAKSHFFEGYLTGVFHKLFKRKVTVRGLNA